MMTETNLPQDDQIPLLPRDLPARLVHAMATVLIAALCAAALLIAIVPLPETVRCAFLLVPQGGADPVKSSRKGTIEQVTTTLGRSVKKGEVLFVVRSEGVRQLETRRRTLQRQIASARQRLVERNAEADASTAADGSHIAELEAKIARLQAEKESALRLDDALVKQREHALAATKAKVQRYTSEVKFLRNLVTLNEDLLERAKKLLEQGASTPVAVIRQQYELRRAKIDLEQVLNQVAESREQVLAVQLGREVEKRGRSLEARGRDGALAESAEAIARARQQREANRAAAQQRLRELQLSLETDEVKLMSLKLDLENTEGDLLSIVAPYDGTVVKLGVRRGGSVIDRGELLCELAPTGGVLEAEIKVPPKRAGRVTDGQTVRLRFDAFAHTRYGSRLAALTWVSPAADEDATFRAIAALADTQGGHNAVLRAGMGGEARIQTGRRTILQRVLKPFQRTRELIAP